MEFEKNRIYKHNARFRKMYNVMTSMPQENQMLTKDKADEIS